MTTTRALVLARGLGTRMRAHDPGVALTAEQQRAADAGLKAMIPVNGRPFLDFLLSALADAGIRDVALVVAPDHEELRRQYREVAPPSRVTISFVVQDTSRSEPQTRSWSAEPWTRDDPFLAMNADNLYPGGRLADARVARRAGTCPHSIGTISSGRATSRKSASVRSR